MTTELNDQTMYLTGLFFYSGLMALGIIWTGKAISEWIASRQNCAISAAIGSITFAIMFACLTLVVAEPHWLPQGALIPLTRTSAAVCFFAFSHVTATVIIPHSTKTFLSKKD